MKYNAVKVACRLKVFAWFVYLILMYTCVLPLRYIKHKLSFCLSLRGILFTFNFWIQIENYFPNLQIKTWCMTVAKTHLRKLISDLQLLKKVANTPESLPFFYLSNRLLPKDIEWRNCVFTRISADNPPRQCYHKFIAISHGSSIFKGHLGHCSAQSRKIKEIHSKKIS